MNDLQDSRLYQEKELDERIRAWMPVALTTLLCFVIIVALLVYGAAVTAGVFFGAILVGLIFARPEIPLLVVTIMAPLEVYTEKMGTLVPGSGVTPLNGLVLVLVLSVAFHRLAGAKPAAPPSSVDVPLQFFMATTTAALIIGIMTNGLTSQDIGQCLQMMTAVLLYVVARRRWLSRPIAYAAVFVVCTLVLFESIQVMRQYMGVDNSAFAWKLKFTIKGSVLYGNSNDTGAYLTQYGLLAFGMFLGLRKSFWRWPALLVSVAAGVATFATYSRAAYLALLIGMAAMVLYHHRRFLAPLLLIVAILPSVLPDTIMGRVEERGDTSALNRKELWRRGMYLMLTKPWGVGWRGFSRDTGKDAHNFYVLTGAEQGIAGLAALLFLYAAAGREIMKAVRTARTPFTQALSIGLFGSLVALLINNMFGSRMVWFYGGAHFWMLLGVLFVLTHAPPEEGGEPVLEVHEPENAPALSAPSPWRYRDYR